MADLTYYNDQELPVATFDWSAAGEDFSTGWTFTVRLCRTTAKTTTVLLKTTGITSSATVVTVAWSTTDWSGLEAAVNGTDYVLYLYARRTADSKDLEFRPGRPTTLRLYAAAGTSAVSPSSYPITVTAASVTVADAGGYYTGTNVETVLAEIRPQLSYPRQRRVPFKNLPVVSDFQTGHGWTNAGGTGVTWSLNDTTDFAVGTQCISGVTDGTASQRYIRKTGLTLDLSASHLLLWVKCADWDALSTIDMTLGSSTFTNTRTLTIYDYTTGVDGVRYLRDNEWTPLRISMAQTIAGSGSLALSTITELQFAVTDRTGGTTIKFGGVYRVPNQALYPNGVVSVSLDDCYLSDYSYAFPTMARRGFAGTVYSIASRMDGVNGPTVAQYREMAKYGWDIAVHGATNLSTLTDAEIVTDMLANKANVQANGLGDGEHYAYPNGNHSATIEGIAAKYFASARLASIGTVETPVPGLQLRLRAQLVQSSTSTASVQTQIDNAYARPAWLHLVFHDLVTAGATGANYLRADFATIIDYLYTKGIPVLPVADVLRSLVPT